MTTTTPTDWEAITRHILAENSDAVGFWVLAHKIGEASNATQGQQARIVEALERVANEPPDEGHAWSEADINLGGWLHAVGLPDYSAATDAIAAAIRANR